VRVSESGRVVEAHVEGDDHNEVASVLRSLLPSAAAQGRRRPRLPTRVEKEVYQQAGSHCSFCSEHAVAALQVHHIDGNTCNNAVDNLLVLCASCHAKVTAGVIPLERVVARKQQLQAELTE
jgi:5-methylcytosine-specific restriction endonuclease McrA